MGTVYVVSNASIPNFVKVGFTQRSIKERLSELNNTSVPTPFVLVFFCEVTNPALVEKLIHSHLSNKFKQEKEFFKARPDVVVMEIVQLIDEGKFLVFRTGGYLSASFLTKGQKARILEVETKNRTHAEAEKKRASERKAYVEKRAAIAQPYATEVSAIIKKYEGTEKESFFYTLWNGAGHYGWKQGSNLVRKKLSTIEKESLKNFAKSLADLELQDKWDVMELLHAPNLFTLYYSTTPTSRKDNSLWYRAIVLGMFDELGVRWHYQT